MAEAALLATAPSCWSAGTFARNWRSRRNVRASMPIRGSWNGIRLLDSLGVHNA
jgi:hypothetical protein